MNKKDAMVMVISSERGACTVGTRFMITRFHRTGSPGGGADLARRASYWLAGLCGALWLTTIENFVDGWGYSSMARGPSTSYVSLQIGLGKTTGVRSVV